MDWRGGGRGGGRRWREEVEGGGGGRRWRGGAFFFFHMYDFKQHFYTTSVAPWAWPPSTCLKHITVHFRLFD